MDHAIISNQANKVFHGLVQVFLADELLSSKLSSMRKPVTQFYEKTNSTAATSFRKSYQLSGGDSTPTAATDNFTLAGSTFTGNVLRIILRAIPLAAGTSPSLSQTDFYNVVVEYVVQSSATLTTAGTGFKNAINAAIAGTTITNGRVYVENTNVFSKADIAAGLALKYAACTGTSPNIVINGAATGGTVQNAYDFTLECCPTPPGLFTFSSDGYITTPGLDYLGATIGANINTSATVQPVPTDQSYSKLDSYVTEVQGTLTVNAIQDRDPKVIRELSQIAGFTSTDFYSIIAPNFFSSAPPRSIILQYDSQEFPGNPCLAVVRAAKSFNAQYGREKTHKPIAGSFDIIASDSQDLFYLAEYRPTINA